MLRQLGKKFIPISLKNQLKRLIGNLRLLVVSIFRKTGRLSSFFYAFLSEAFDREHQGVMYGIKKYRENYYLDQGTSFMLRRNTHRIEKGLIMKPRRDIFALDYIEETVNCYEKLVMVDNFKNSGCSELHWSRDVLSVYFREIGAHPIIEKAKRKFYSLAPITDEENFRIPYLRKLKEGSPVDYDKLLELARQRRSVRWYLPTPVSRISVDKAIELAAQSPSACNRQPFEFRVFDLPELVQKVSSLAGGTANFHENFPMVIVLVGKLGAYEAERDRHLIYIDGALAAMSFMLALETLSLSSCAINWPDVKTNEKAMTSLLNLAPDERVILLISVGYPDPDGLVPYSQKKEIALLRRYNLD